MNNEAVFLGLPKDFHQKFLIYPPTVKQIVGNPKFSQYKTLLTLSQEDLEDVFIKNNKEKGFKDYDKFKVPTPYEYLFIIYVYYTFRCVLCVYLCNTVSTLETKINLYTISNSNLH